MQYDIAMKTFLETAREEFFREILKEDIAAVEEILELPQESVSVKSTDFPVLVKNHNGESEIHIVEFQSDWKAEKVLDLAEYTLRFRRKYRLPVKPIMVLFRKNRKAANVYQDHQFSFSFHLVKIWEMDAKTFLDKGLLLPLIPVMNGGISLTYEAERLIYETSGSKRADHLTILTIMAGMVSRALSAELCFRRRDIMIESAFYDIVKEEWRLIGQQEGELKGELRGKLEGKMETARKLQAEGFDIQFIIKVTGLTPEVLREAGIFR